MIYFDAAATTLQKPPAVAQAVAAAISRCASVGRGSHAAAQRAANLVYDCRETAAALFEAEPEQVAFTMNATHGLNIAIKSLLSPGDHAVISGLEHNAVTRPLSALGAQVTVAAAPLFSPEKTLQAFADALQTRPKAVICNCVSNVYGEILPYEQIAALCRAAQVPLILDASQAAGVLPLSLRRSGAAFIAMPGHKGLYGPQGTGILLCSGASKTLIEGGTGSESERAEMPDFLPDRLEAGTHNVCGIAGLLTGLRYVRQKTTAAIARHERRLLRRLCESLSTVRSVELFTGGNQLGVLSMRLKNTDCEEAAQVLAQNGVAVRAGLHCAPAAHRTGGTLQTGTLRVSFSAFNTEREMMQFTAICKKLFSS